MDFPQQHLGHSYGPAPTNDQLGISNRISGSLEAVHGLIEIDPDDHIVAAVKKLLADGYKGQALWNILTALRGPDDEEHVRTALKEATTGVLRHKLGLNQWDVGAFISNPDEKYFLEVRKQTSICKNWHFIKHASAAFTSLGLIWDEVNG